MEDLDTELLFNILTKFLSNLYTNDFCSNLIMPSLLGQHTAMSFLQRLHITLDHYLQANLKDFH